MQKINGVDVNIKETENAKHNWILNGWNKEKAQEDLSELPYIELIEEINR